MNQDEVDIFESRHLRARQYNLQRAVGGMIQSGIMHQQVKPSRRQIQLAQRQKVELSDAMKKQLQKKKRKQRRGRNLRGEVKEIKRKQKIFERGQRRSDPEGDIRLVGEAHERALEVARAAAMGAAAAAAIAPPVAPVAPVAPIVIPAPAPVVIPAPAPVVIPAPAVAVHHHAAPVAPAAAAVGPVGALSAGEFRERVQRADARAAEFASRLGAHEASLGENMAHLREYTRATEEAEVRRVAEATAEREAWQKMAVSLDRRSHELGAEIMEAHRVAGQRQEEGERRIGEVEQGLREHIKALESRLGSDKTEQHLKHQRLQELKGGRRPSHEKFMKSPETPRPEPQPEPSPKLSQRSPEQPSGRLEDLFKEAQRAIGLDDPEGVPIERPEPVQEPRAPKPTALKKFKEEEATKRPLGPTEEEYVRRGGVVPTGAAPSRPGVPSVKETAAKDASRDLSIGGTRPGAMPPREDLGPLMEQVEQTLGLEEDPGGSKVLEEEAQQAAQQEPGVSSPPTKREQEAEEEHLRRRGGGLASPVVKQVEKERAETHKARRRGAEEGAARPPAAILPATPAPRWVD